MLDLLRFDITARDRASAHLSKMKEQLGGIRGALAGVDDYAKRTGRSMRNIGAGLSAGITAPLALMGRQSLAAAVEAEEAGNLFREVFKDAAPAVEEWSVRTAAALGRSRNDLQSQAAGFQQVLSGIFEDRGEASRFSTQLTELTQDLSSFYNVSEDVAAQKIRSALLGESEPIRDFGVLLSAAAIEAKALEMGLAGSKKEITEQDKVLARLNLVMEQTQDAQGDAARTADGLANRYRAFDAAVKDLRIDIGQYLIPVMTKVVEVGTRAVRWFGDLEDGAQRNIVIAGAFAAALGPVLASLGLAVMGLGSLTTAMSGMGAVLLANPVIAAIALIAGGAILIWRNWDALAARFPGIAGVIGGIAESLPARFAGLRDLAGFVAEQVGLAVGVFDALISGDLAEAGRKAEQFNTQLGEVLGSGLNKILSLFGTTWQGIVAEVGAWPGRLIAWGSTAVQGLVEGIRQKYQAVVEAISGIWTTISETVAGWAQQMADLGGSLVDGLIRGITGRNPAVAQGMRGQIKAATQAAKDEAGVRSPSRVFMAIGSDIMEGLAIGLRDTGADAVEAARDIAGQIVGVAEDAKSMSESILGSISQGAKTVFKDVLTGARSFGDSIKGVLGGFANGLIDSGINALFGAIFKFAKGAAFSGGNVVPFASGGVVSSASYFPMSGGRTGVMGEAGPEAIMPLARGSDGKLGVRAQAGGGGAAQRVELTVMLSEDLNARIDNRSRNVSLQVVRQNNRVRDEQFDIRVAAAQETNALRRA